MKMCIALLLAAAIIGCSKDAASPSGNQSWTPGCVDSVAYSEVYADGYRARWEGIIENTAVLRFGWVDSVTGQFTGTGSLSGGIRIDSAGIDLGTYTGVVVQGGSGFLARLRPDTIVMDATSGFVYFAYTVNLGTGPTPVTSTLHYEGPDFGGVVADFYARWAPDPATCGLSSVALRAAAPDGTVALRGLIRAR